jgi:hypothetical protein
MEQFGVAPVQLLGVMDDELRTNYAERFLKDNAGEVVQILRTGAIKDWPLKFTKMLITVLVNNPSVYSKSFYETISLYLPTAIVKDLDSITPSEDWAKNYWPNLSLEIKDLVALKETIRSMWNS